MAVGAPSITELLTDRTSEVTPAVPPSHFLDDLYPQEQVSLLWPSEFTARRHYRSPLGASWLESWAFIVTKVQSLVREDPENHEVWQKKKKILLASSSKRILEPLHFLKETLSLRII